GVGRIGNVLAVRLGVLRCSGRGERECPIRVQVKILRLGFLRRPLGISVPGVRSALKRGGLPRWLLTLAVQVIPEEWRFNILAELARSFVPSKGDDSDAVALGGLPLPVKPGAGHDEIRMLGI